MRRVAVAARRYCGASAWRVVSRRDDDVTCPHTCVAVATGTSCAHAAWHTTRRAYSDNNNSNNNDAAVVRHNDNDDHDDGVDFGRLPSLRTTLPAEGAGMPEDDFLKCLKKEMLDEQLRLDREDAPPRAPDGWQVYHVDGTSLFYARRVWVPPPPPPDAAEATAAWCNDNNNNNNNDDDDGKASSPRAAAAATAASPVRRHVERHYVRVQLTCRDASLDPECDIRGEHFPFSLFVQRVASAEDEAAAVAEAAAAAAAERQDGDNSNNNDDSDKNGDSNNNDDKHKGESDAHAAEARRLRVGFADGDMVSADTDDDASATLSIFRHSIEVRCDVVDGELIAKHVVLHGDYALPSDNDGNDNSNNDNDDEASTLRQRAVYDNLFGGYTGPPLSEADDELLDGLHAWLAERGIDDQFGEFVSQYSVWIEQAEYERWLQQLHDFVAA